jgi:hypothetical protein
MDNEKPEYVPPRLVELGDAAILTEGCHPQSHIESDCGYSPAPLPIPAN